MLRGRPDADLNPTATKVFLETLEEPTLTTDDRKFTSVNYLKASVWDEIKGVNGEWLLEKHKHRVDPGGKQTPPSGAEGNAEDHALIENSNIPKRVFRTDKTFSPSSWQKVDKTFTDIFYDDEMMKQYLRANWPEFSPYIDKLDIVELSDIFRYAVVYDQGGVWTDSDVDLKKPLDQWVRPAARGADLLLSLEFPQSCGYCGITNPYQILQWNFGAAPKNPVLAHVLQFVLRALGSEAKDILFRTGPGIWSHAILDAISKYATTRKGVDNLNHPLALEGKFKIDGADNADVVDLSFPGIQRNVRVVIMSAQQFQYPHELLTAHHWKGSWKHASRMHAKDPCKEGFVGQRPHCWTGDPR